MVSVKLRNDVKEFENGTTPYEIVKGFGGGFFKQVCACKIDGEVYDLRTPINNDCTLDFLTFDDPDARKHFGILLLMYLLKQLKDFTQMQSVQSVLQLIQVSTMTLM